MTHVPHNFNDFIKEKITAIPKGPRPMQLYLKNCIKCGTCAEVCPVYAGQDNRDFNPARRADIVRKLYHRYCTVPGKIISLFRPKLELDEKDAEKWKKLFYECTACRRCAIYCPMGIDSSSITYAVRTMLDEIGHTPERLQKVIEVSKKFGNTDGATSEAFHDVIAFLEEEMAEEHDGEKIKIPLDVVGAKYFYLPPSGDVLVNPESTMGIAKVFHVLGLGDQWTMSSKYFDGANYGLFTGGLSDMQEINKSCVEEAKRLGCEILFMGECGHAYRVMKMIMEKNKWWGDLPFKIINCMQFTSDAIRKGLLQFDKRNNTQPITFHDPCNFARSCGIFEEPREIIKAACMDFREMTPNRYQNFCCGGGGGLSAMDAIQDFRMTISGKKKLDQIHETGAELIATACSNCKRQLSQLMEYHKLHYPILGVHDVVSRALLINGKPANVDDTL